MARKTLIQSFTPTKEELILEKIDQDRIRREHKKLEKAAKRFGLSFDGSGMSLWNLAVRLEERVRPHLTKKELIRESTTVAVRRGRKPNSESYVFNYILLQEVRASRSVSPEMSEADVLRELILKHHKYKRMTYKGLKGRLDRAKKSLGLAR